MSITKEEHAYLPSQDVLTRGWDPRGTNENQEGPGLLLTMEDGTRWFHSYRAGQPFRVTDKRAGEFLFDRRGR